VRRIEISEAGAGTPGKKAERRVERDAV
jgi:hypothetical protein